MLSQKSLFPIRSAALVLAMGLLASASIAQPGPGRNENAMQETRDIASVMLKELGQTLQSALANGGPENAIGVCKTQAPEIAKNLSLKHQLLVARVGTRARNPVMVNPTNGKPKRSSNLSLASHKATNLKILNTWKWSSQVLMTWNCAMPNLSCCNPCVPHAMVPLSKFLHLSKPNFWRSIPTTRLFTTNLVSSEAR